MPFTPDETISQNYSDTTTPLFLPLLLPYSYYSSTLHPASHIYPSPPRSRSTSSAYKHSQRLALPSTGVIWARRDAYIEVRQGPGASGDQIRDGDGEAGMVLDNTYPPPHDDENDGAPETLISERYHRHHRLRAHEVGGVFNSTTVKARQPGMRGRWRDASGNGNDKEEEEDASPLLHASRGLVPVPEPIRTDRRQSVSPSSKAAQVDASTPPPKQLLSITLRRPNPNRLPPPHLLPPDVFLRVRVRLKIAYPAHSSLDPRQ
ncbi:hypothetical protein R3P38DRAFT_3183407 [Favolaschia claudopus]|uniref:Uncharacterized protein n=1 Tax=Favolaschia claudopus TaxID=2862362 RepID=A0AAW0CA21_9AGAR